MAIAIDPRFVSMPNELLDTTLRDGSYTVDFQFDEKFVVELLRRLNETSIQKIEIGHGIGVEAERVGIKACNIELELWCDYARSELTNASWGMFAQPRFSRLKTLKKLSDLGMSFVRIGMEVDRVPGNLEYIERATDVCEEVYLNLMKTSSTPCDELPGLLGEVTPNIAGIYIVDSYGSMIPDEVHRYVTAVKDICPVVGFHGHDNLGMANINSLAALEAGAKIVDGTLNGIGRGAGNAQTESLAGIFKILGNDRYDYKELAKLAEFCRAGMDVILEDRMMQVLGGVIGVHSELFPLIEELCADFVVDAASVMETAVELAPRSVVGKADIQSAVRHITGSAEAADSAL